MTRFASGAQLWRANAAGHLTIVERAEPITATSAHALVAEIVAAAVEPLDPVAHLVERDDKERQHDV